MPFLLGVGWWEMDIAIGVINVMMYFECYGIVNILVGNGCGVWEINRRSLGRAPIYISYRYI
jgi:membrane glycosyltransferase